MNRATIDDMIRSLLWMSTLLGASVLSFVACGSADSSPIGLGDGGTRASSGTTRSPGSSGDFDDDNSNGGGSSGTHPSSSGQADGSCKSSYDCVDGADCVTTNGVGACVLPDGGDESSSGGTSSGQTGSSSGDGTSSSSSGGNPGGKQLDEPCSVDSECASNLCVNTKETTVKKCSKSCTTKGADSSCPSDLPRCGDDFGHDGLVCRPAS